MAIFVYFFFFSLLAANVKASIRNCATAITFENCERVYMKNVAVFFLYTRVCRFSSRKLFVLLFTVAWTDVWWLSSVHSTYSIDRRLIDWIKPNKESWRRRWRWRWRRHGLKNKAICRWQRVEKRQKHTAYRRDKMEKMRLRHTNRTKKKNNNQEEMSRLIS